MYTSQTKVDSLIHQGYQVRVVQRFPHFHISQLTGKFLYHKKRDQAIDYFVIATINTTAPFFASDKGDGLHRPTHTDCAEYLYWKAPH